MKEYNSDTPVITVYVLILILLLSSQTLLGQDTNTEGFSQDFLVNAAKEMMTSTGYCALITLDNSGHPQARIMNPFLPEDDLTVWFGTNNASRKVKEIKNDPRVTVYYQPGDASGYAVLTGKAYLVDDNEMKKKYWKKEWENFYSEGKSNYLLIKVIPDKLEIIDYSNNITGDPDTWAVPRVILN